MTKIVTFGGGTGAPIIIQALLQAGFTDISCICASMDSGGKTGLIRSDERDQVIAISDLLRNLLALIPSTKQQKNLTAFTDLVSYIDGRQRNLGYTIYYALLEKYHNNFLLVQKHFEALLGLEFAGTAIPITADSSNLCFRTRAGQTFRGEHELDKQSLSKNIIKDLWLDPEVHATPEALQAIREADYLIFCPGSLYGSVLANFLPLGVKEALQQSSAKKILVTNLVSNRNQTHHFTPQKYLRVFQKFTGLKKPFNYLIIPRRSRRQFEKRFPKTTATYAREHSHFLGWSSKTLRQFHKHHIKVITSNTMTITPHLSRLRHSSQKLALVFQKILK